jgi:hypothetical protein
MEVEIDLRKYINDKEIAKSLVRIFNRELDEYENKYEIKLKLEKNKKYKILLPKVSDTYSDIYIIYPKNNYNIKLNDIPEDLSRLVNSYLNFEINAYLYSSILERNINKFENKEIKKLELNFENLHYFNINDYIKDYDKQIKKKIPINAIHYDDIYINIISTGNIEIILNLTNSIVKEEIRNFMMSSEYIYKSNINKLGEEKEKKIIIKGGLLYHDLAGQI